MVAYPFCLYDCDIPVQGAVAIVLTTAERARDLKPRPAYLAGYGERLRFEVAGRIGSLASYMEGGRSSAELTWERSGFGRDHSAKAKRKAATPFWKWPLTLTRETD